MALDAAAAELTAWIVRGAREGDPVRTHGAIEAALQLHPMARVQEVFTAVMHELADDRATSAFAARAITRQLEHHHG